MSELADPIPAEGPLEPADRERLHKAILAAYPDADDLEILLSHKWGVRLSDQVYLEQPNRKIANELVEWTESEGRTRELLGLLWSGRPGNPLLRPLAEQLLGDLAPVAARYGARAPAEAPAAPAITRYSLEKTVTERSRLSDFGAFVARLGVDLGLGLPGRDAAFQGHRLPRRPPPRPHQLPRRRRRRRDGRARAPDRLPLRL